MLSRRKAAQNRFPESWDHQVISVIRKLFGTGASSVRKPRLPEGIRVYVVGDIHGRADLLDSMLARTGRTALAAPAVGAYIGAAYWFTSSTSFANPAATVGRMLSDTFAGIAPNSVPAFIGMQLIGLAVGVLIVVIIYPWVGVHDDAADFHMPLENDLRT
jgi:hypothetical protein